MAQTTMDNRKTKQTNKVKRMKKETYYCDYCKKKLTTHTKIKTTWYNFWSRTNNIGGDGCKDCYLSYKDWVRSRWKKR